MRTVVTGATGFVGRRTCWQLAAAGYEIVAVVRRTPQTAIAGAAQTVQVCNLEATQTWREVLHDTDAQAVVHLIGHTHAAARADRAAAVFERVNVDITRAVVTAAKETAIRRFVYMSSVKALAERSEPGRALADTDPAHPEDAYGRSKLRAEDVVESATMSGNFAAVSLRPPLVYGRGAGGNFTRLAQLVRSGIPLPLASIENRRSLIFVGNLASAVMAALSDEVPTGRYLVSDAHDVSTPELIRTMADSMGGAAHLFPLPKPMMATLAAAPGLSGIWNRLAGSLTVDPAPFMSAANWRPPISFKRAMQCSLGPQQDYCPVTTDSRL